MLSLAQPRFHGIRVIENQNDGMHIAIYRERLSAEDRALNIDDELEVDEIQIQYQDGRSFRFVDGESYQQFFGSYWQPKRLENAGLSPTIFFSDFVDGLINFAALNLNSETSNPVKELVGRLVTFKEQKRPVALNVASDCIDLTI